MISGKHVLITAFVALPAFSGCSGEEEIQHHQSTAEVFASGVISDEREQYRITFTPSGDTAYFAAGDGFFPLTREATIYVSERIDGILQPPTIASFSGEYPDIDPFISPDGRRLYFSSIRPSSEGVDSVIDLWMMERDGNGWSEPERLPINLSEDALYPSVDAEGILYFASPLPDGGPWRIMAAHPTSDGYADPQPVPGDVNVEGNWSFNPAVSADGTRLVFTRLNPADAQTTGFGELFVSIREGSTWREAIPLDSLVNTPADEYHPSFSPDERTFYFVRRDPFTEQPNGDLYHIPVAVLGGPFLAQD